MLFTLISEQIGIWLSKPFLDGAVKVLSPEFEYKEVSLKKPFEACLLQLDLYENYPFRAWKMWCVSKGKVRAKNNSLCTVGYLNHDPISISVLG